MVYKLKSGFILRKIGDQIMAVPVGAQTSHIHGMIALTESGELLWNALRDGADENTLTNLLTENYELVPPLTKKELAFLNWIMKEGEILLLPIEGKNGDFMIGVINNYPESVILVKP